MALNYKELKFKSGLEIHQQLNTSTKLFCNCPCILRKDNPDFEISRKLHAVAGESGEIDIAAKHQAELNKEFIYQGYRDNTCLVELDEAPPHEIDKDALKITIQIALLMNMQILPIAQIMRKTVIDGSNTTGFQRTVLIAREGFIETSFGKVGIDYLYLEEDSARITLKDKEKEYYNLDRLGIPLVEIVTAPDVKTPEQAKEVALKIGEILRSCDVRRGIGTIRQDVNISIRGEKRVEIKGMQDMGIFIKAIENEIERQKQLSDMKKPTKMEVRNVLPDASSEFMRPLPGSARMYPETDLPLLKISKDFIDKVRKSLPQLKGEIEKELKEKGLSEEMIKLLFKQKKLDLFKELIKIPNKPSLVAKTILLFPKEIAVKENQTLEKIDKILEDNYNTVLDLVASRKITENEIKDFLIDLVKGKSLKEILKKEKADSSEVEENILKIIKQNPGLSANAYMGIVMKEFKGKINAKEVMDLVKKFVK
mgnify:FL=1